MASLIPARRESELETSLSESKRKKRRKTEDAATRYDDISETRGVKRWRTDREQQIYSSKLCEALRRSRRSSAAGGCIGKEVRETADRVLAVSAKGATRWSRAILAARRGSTVARLKKHKRAKVTANSRLKKPDFTRERRKVPLVERKVKVLSRLVPGCRKLPLSNLLDEATDYIAALEMQVRAMTALTQILTSSGAPPPADRPGSSNANS